MEYAVVILALGCFGFCFWGIKLSLELAEARASVLRLERRLMETIAKLYKLESEKAGKW
jgi:hypothetical protein